MSVEGAAAADIPDLVDVCDDDDSDGWDEMEVSGGEQTTCLFCPSTFHTIAVALDHCRSEHNFDLLELKTKYNMDCYSFIKMINYIRLHKPTPDIILKSEVALWEDEVYLKPGEMESWLMYDFDDLGSTPSTPHYAIDGKTPVVSHTFADLQCKIHELTVQLREKDNLLQNAIQDMAKMRQVTKTIVQGQDDEDEGGDYKKGSEFVINTSDYFNSYSHFAIHHEMLSDAVRTESYRDAFMKNTDTIKDKVVLDVGCGTGILSMFAAKAGASKVYGIDQSEVIYNAINIIKENDLFEKVHLMRGQIENTSLPVEKVDVLVSEWMGYFLLFEGMLDSFIYARDKFLNADGIVMPNKCTISLVGCCDTEAHKNVVTYWEDVYGFKMKSMQYEVIKEPHIEMVPSDKIITTVSVLTELDLKTCQVSAGEFLAPFELEVLQDGAITSFAGYFDTFFDLPNPVMFSTGPNCPKTHWQQTVFYLLEPIEVKKGEKLKGTLKCSRLLKKQRSLSVIITIGETHKYQYTID